MKTLFSSSKFITKLSCIFVILFITFLVVEFFVIAMNPELTGRTENLHFIRIFYFAGALYFTSALYFSIYFFFFYKEKPEDEKTN